MQEFTIVRSLTNGKTVEHKVKHQDGTLALREHCATLTEEEYNVTESIEIIETLERDFPE